jgi:hypothetical protein
MTLKNLVSPIPIGATVDAAGVILAAWGAACWCARIPRNFEEQRKWMNR